MMAVTGLVQEATAVTEAEVPGPESEVTEAPEERAEPEPKEDGMTNMKIRERRAQRGVQAHPEKAAALFMFWMELPCMHMGGMAGAELLRREIYRGDRFTLIAEKECILWREAEAAAMAEAAGLEPESAEEELVEVEAEAEAAELPATVPVSQMEEAVEAAEPVPVTAQLRSL